MIVITLNDICAIVELILFIVGCFIAYKVLKGTNKEDK